MGMLPEKTFGSVYIILGVILYILLNWSYFTAVFTDPGLPALTDTHSDDILLNSITVKYNGEMRFCNKCQSRKPDRAHHCSTCRRCVLKMDHHCPWLATCVGLRNYKPFLLFLIYTTLFSWLCFWVSGSWLYRQMLLDGSMEGSVMPVHFVVLSVISGIIGIVITGFTAYHIFLTTRNRTTIESLEKTRYLSPLRTQVDQRLNEQQTYANNDHHSFGEQLRDLGNTLTEIHANSLPGILRPEEGEDAPSPATASLQRTMDLEAQRERQQYLDYLDERDSDRLPNAFDLGWRRNLMAVFGPKLWLWGLPICNSIGDGWRWEMSGEFKRERERLRREREAEMNGQQNGMTDDSWRSRQLGQPPTGRRRHSPYANIVDSSDEEDEADQGNRRLLKPNGYDNWNDVPDEMLVAGRKGQVMR
jgi:palmitoyltransferase ZDHHC2/15/20